MQDRSLVACSRCYRLGLFEILLWLETRILDLTTIQYRPSLLSELFAYINFARIRFLKHSQTSRVESIREQPRCDIPYVARIIGKVPEIDPGNEMVIARYAHSILTRTKIPCRGVL